MFFGAWPLGFIVIVGPTLHVKSDCMWGRLYSRMSFIYKYETSTLSPFVKPCDILNLAVRNVFVHVFTWNPLLRTLWGWPKQLQLIFTNFWKTWATFYVNIWSHCLWHKINILHILLFQSVTIFLSLKRYGGSDIGWMLQLQSD